MLKQISKLEVKVNDRIYNFTCDNDVPLEHVKEALFQFQKFIGQIEDNAKASQELALSEAKALEESKVCQSEEVKPE